MQNMQPEESQMLEFNDEELAKLKQKYSEAVKDRQEIFVFQGKEILTEYAKYLIEYVEAKLGIYD